MHIVFNNWSTDGRPSVFFDEDKSEQPQSNVGKYLDETWVSLGAADSVVGY